MILKLILNSSYRINHFLIETENLTFAQTKKAV